MIFIRFEDYGNLFTNAILNNHTISISVSNIEAGMLVLV
jgi:hypothetical protein